jgi:hypothetical protein
MNESTISARRRHPDGTDPDLPAQWIEPPAKGAASAVALQLSGEPETAA